jgi:hypothetical protein
MTDAPPGTLRTPNVTEGAVDDVVVRHRFAFPHAAALACLAALVMAASFHGGGSDTVAPTTGPPAADGVWIDADDLHMLRNAFPPPSPAVEDAMPPADPSVDKAFAALDQKNLAQLEAFLVAYRDHAYAKARGYLAQVDRWRENAQWELDEAQRRKEQSAAEWSFD